MTNTEARGTRPHQSATDIRDETFARRMRGIDADEVYAYLDALADQVQASESELDELRAQNDRLQSEVHRLRTELDEYEQVGERVNEQVVQLFSQAQLVAEEMVEDVSRDARERIGHARAHERQIVEHAMDTAGQQVAEYARSAQDRMRSVMESFANDVDRLATPLTDGSARSTSSGRDPLFDDLDDWEASVRNGRGRAYPGSD